MTSTCCHQISRLKLEVEQLQKDLLDANSKAILSDDSTRELLKAKPPPSTSPKIPAKLSPCPAPQPSNSDSDHRPVSALSEEDIKIHENGEVSSEDELDDAFDKKVPSPVAPCPYIDFVPLHVDETPKTKSKSKDVKGTGSSKGAESGGKGEEPVAKSKDSDVSMVASEKRSPGEETEEMKEREAMDREATGNDNEEDVAEGEEMVDSEKEEVKEETKKGKEGKEPVEGNNGS